MTLPESDVRLVVEALDDLDGEPGPWDPGPFGTPLGVAGAVLLVGVPTLGRSLGLPTWAAVVVLSAGLLLLVVGVVLAVNAGGFQRRASHAAREAALRQLESGDDDRELLLRAATLLVTSSAAEAGEAASDGSANHEARRRIPAMIPLVEDVERILLARGRASAVFTAGADEAPPGLS